MLTWSTTSTMPKTKGIQTDSNAEEVTMASISHLLKTHRKAISEDFKQSFSTLETKLNGVVLNTHTEHSEKIEILETECDACEVCLKAAELAIINLQTDHANVAGSKCFCLNLRLLCVV